jgi:type II secretory pathway component PulJ
MPSRTRGALLLDVLIGIALLMLLTALAGGLIWSGLQVVREQTRSAEALAQARQALASLAKDVPAAREVHCSGERLRLVTSDGQHITYGDAAAGLKRAGLESAPADWPLLRAKFALSQSGLVEVRMTIAGSERRPATICESAIWARALPTS